MVVSPKLDWMNAPANTQTFVLLMHDPDVARNRTTDDQTHWIIWNIPGTAKGLPENVPAQPVMPDGAIQGKNVAGNIQSPSAIAAPALRRHSPSITIRSSISRSITNSIWVPTRLAKMS